MDGPLLFFYSFFLLLLQINNRCLLNSPYIEKNVSSKSYNVSTTMVKKQGFLYINRSLLYHIQHNNQRNIYLKIFSWTTILTTKIHTQVALYLRIISNFRFQTLDTCTSKTKDNNICRRISDMQNCC